MSLKKTGERQPEVADRPARMEQGQAVWNGMREFPSSQPQIEEWPPGGGFLKSSTAVALHLKFLRVQSGMTLEDLARDSGLTRSYLSKVERGISTPSIESALAIAKALGVTVDRLFGQQAEDDPVTIVRGNGKSAGDPNMHLSLVAGLKDDRAMRAFVVRPGKTQRRGRIMSHHEGEEVLFVLTGKIELQLGARKEVLSPGDCVQFDSTIPHKLVALTDEAASALVVIAALA